MENRAQDYITKLQLVSHPEGGFYKEVYRTDEIINSSCLPPRYSGNRCFGTLIYYLLQNNQKSKFHILKSDEIWHHLEGCGVEIHTIDPVSGNYELILLGKELDENQRPQQIVRRGLWFAAKLTDESSFALTGCTVVPGFEFDDFELADRDDMINKFPEYIEIIKKFT